MIATTPWSKTTPFYCCNNFAYFQPSKFLAHMHFKLESCSPPKQMLAASHNWHLVAL